MQRFLENCNIFKMYQCISFQGSAGLNILNLSSVISQVGYFSLLKGKEKISEYLGESYNIFGRLILILELSLQQ